MNLSRCSCYRPLALPSEQQSGLCAECDGQSSASCAVCGAAMRPVRAAGVLAPIAYMGCRHTEGEARAADQERDAHAAEVARDADRWAADRAERATELGRWGAFE